MNNYLKSLIAGLLLTGILALPHHSFAQSGPTTVKLRMSGTQVRNYGPNVTLKVNGSLVKQFSNISTTPTDYVYASNTTLRLQQLTVEYTNDATDKTASNPSQRDRNLTLHMITVGNNSYVPASLSSTYSTGSWTSTTGCSPGYKSINTLHCNGAFTWVSPAPTNPVSTRQPSPSVRPSTSQIPSPSAPISLTRTPSISPTTPALPTPIGCRQEFPIISYNNGGGAAEYARTIYSKTGINVVLANTNNPTADLNVAAANGVQLLFGLDSFVVMPDMSTSIVSQGKLRDFVKLVKNHPGLYGYLYLDEPDLHYVRNEAIRTNFKTIIDIVRQEDPNHPSLVHSSGTGVLRNTLPEFFDYADMTGSDYYSVMHPKDVANGKTHWSWADTESIWRRMVSLTEASSQNKTKNYYFIGQANGIMPLKYEDRMGTERYYVSLSDLRRQVEMMKQITTNKPISFGALWWYLYEWPTNDNYAFEKGMLGSTRLMADVKTVSGEVQGMYRTGQLTTNYPVRIGCRSGQIPTVTFPPPSTISSAPPTSTQVPSPSRTPSPAVSIPPISSMIDATSCKVVSPDLFGINTNGYSLVTSKSGYLSQFNPSGRLSTMKPQTLRFPGGCPGDSYNYRTKQFEYLKKWGQPGGNESFMSISDMIGVGQDLNAKIIYQINIDATKTANPCGDISNYPNLGSYDLNLAQLVNDAKDIVSTYGTQIAIYQLGNEQWDNLSPSQYTALAQQFAQAMKAINPNIKIAILSYPTWGIGSSAEVDWSAAVNQIKNQTCNGTRCYDYISDHPYADKPNSANGTLVTSTIDQYRSSFVKRITDFAPLKLALTEWNVGGCWNTTTPPFQSQEHAMYALKSLLTMAQTGVSISSWHDLTKDNSCSVFTPTGQLTLTSQALSLMSTIQPAYYVNTNINIADVASYGIQARDGLTYIFLFNQSSTAKTVQNIVISSGIQISAPSLSAKNPTTTSLGSSTGLTLPPYSISRVVVSSSPTCSIAPLPTDIVLPTTQAQPTQTIIPSPLPSVTVTPSVGATTPSLTLTPSISPSPSFSPSPSPVSISCPPGSNVVSMQTSVDGQTVQDTVCLAEGTGLATKSSRFVCDPRCGLCGYRDEATGKCNNGGITFNSPEQGTKEVFCCERAYVGNICSTQSNNTLGGDSLINACTVEAQLTPQPSVTPAARYMCDVSCGGCGYRDTSNNECGNGSTPDGLWCCERQCIQNSCVTVFNNTTNGDAISNSCENEGSSCTRISNQGELQNVSALAETEVITSQNKTSSLWETIMIFFKKLFRI